MGHLPAVVDEVARRLAGGATGGVRGGSVVVTAPDGSALSVACRDGGHAADLLAAAAEQSVGAAYDPVRARVAAEAASVAAANKATVLHERNRWLTETDPYVLPVESLPSDMPDGVLAVLSAQGTPSAQGTIKAWRQALRDYPSTVADWTAPPPLPAPPNIVLPSGRPLIIVT